MAVGAPLREPPSRGRIWLRRILAVGVLLLLLGGAAALVLTIRGGGDAAPPPPTTTAPPPKPLRIVFPEGFTIDQMAQRITAVDRIAVRRRHVRPRLSAARRRSTAVVPAPRT